MRLSQASFRPGNSLRFEKWALTPYSPSGFQGEPDGAFKRGSRPEAGLVLLLDGTTVGGWNHGEFRGGGTYVFAADGRRLQDLEVRNPLVLASRADTVVIVSGFGESSSVAWFRITTDGTLVQTYHVDLGPTRVRPWVDQRAICIDLGIREEDVGIIVITPSGIRILARHHENDRSEPCVLHPNALQYAFRNEPPL